MPQDTHLSPKYVDMNKNTRFPAVFTPFPVKVGVNLPGNGTESVVAWNALAVDGAWHGSALIPLVVNTAGRFSSGSLCVDIRKKHFRRIVSLFATLGVPMSLFAALGVPMRKETPECAKKHQEATGGPGQPREGGRRMPGETPRSPGRPPTGSKIAQDSPKMTQDAPKRPPAGPKMGPRWPKMDPKRQGVAKNLARFPFPC